MPDIVSWIAIGVQVGCLIAIVYFAFTGYRNNLVLEYRLRLLNGSINATGNNDLALADKLLAHYEALPSYRTMVFKQLFRFNWDDYAPVVGEDSAKD